MRPTTLKPPMRKPRGKTHVTQTKPPPVGGIDTVNPRALMPPNNAVVLDNFISSEAGLAMKMLDPTSVVREGEAASVRNAAGVPDRIINWYNNTLTGDQLGPKQRAEILATAEGLAQVAQKGYDSTVRQYNDKARRRGLNPLNVTGVDDTPPKAPPGRDVDVGNRLGNKPPAPAPPTAFPLTRGATGGY